MRGGVVGMSRKEFFEYLPSFSLVTFGITDEYGADERTLGVGGKPVDLLKTDRASHISNPSEGIPRHSC